MGDRSVQAAALYTDIALGWKPPHQNETAGKTPAAVTNFAAWV